MYVATEYVNTHLDESHCLTRTYEAISIHETCTLPMLLKFVADRSLWHYLTINYAAISILQTQLWQHASGVCNVSMIVAKFGNFKKI